MSKYDEARVIRSLAKKQVKVNVVDKTVTVPYGATNLGNGSWGKIDFLCNHLGYVLTRVGRFIDNPNVIAYVSGRELKKQEKELQKKRKMNKNN